MKPQKTKIFISCGQKKDSVETKIAKQIEDKLINLGFDTYLALEQHSLRSLKENIFKHLMDSEYFLFVDFKREQLNNSNNFRGSLYTNQELAIASFLEKEVIPFQQKGILHIDGMLSSLQLNPIKFNNKEKNKLPDLIEQQIKQSGWNNQWKNKLDISIHPNYSDADKQSGDVGRHYFLRIDNLHKDKIAFNCTAYVKSIVNKTNNLAFPTETVELKWAGSLVPSVTIMPKSCRLLDAFFVLHSKPDRLRFSSFSDSLKHLGPLTGTREYEIVYIVVSENFPLLEIKTNINITGNVYTISFD
ncbi:MAG: hypothetical protein ABSH06_18290 [Thermodesulfobacteriota bacterium]